MDGLNTLQEKSITLAQASGMSLDAAAEALAGTVNQFGLGADQAERVINVLAAGSKYGAAEIGELAQGFKVAGASASAMGLSVEETAGALEVLSVISDGEWPAPVRHAVLMRAATMYAYREDVDNASLSPLPFALSALLKPYRKMCGGSVMERILAKYKPATEKEVQE